MQSQNDLESQSVSSGGSGGDTRQSNSAVARSSPSSHDYTLHAYISATGQCQLNRVGGQIIAFSDLPHVPVLLSIRLNSSDSQQLSLVVVKTYFTVTSLYVYVHVQHVQYTSILQERLALIWPCSYRLVA